MKGSDHADAVLDKVLADRPWILEDSKRAGRGRYARIYEYRKNVSLQVLFASPKPGFVESLEVGLAFDDLSRDVNTSNLDDYRQQLGDNESQLGLEQRDGETGVYYYLTRSFPLMPNPNSAYDEAADLCLNILDLVLGGRAVSERYRLLRNKHDKSKK